MLLLLLCFHFTVPSPLFPLILFQILHLSHYCSRRCCWRCCAFDYDYYCSNCCLFALPLSLSHSLSLFLAAICCPECRPSHSNSYDSFLCFVDLILVIVLWLLLLLPTLTTLLLSLLLFSGTMWNFRNGARCQFAGSFHCSPHAARLKSDNVAFPW